MDVKCPASGESHRNEWRNIDGTNYASGHQSFDSIRFPAVDGQGNVYVGETWGCDASCNGTPYGYGVEKFAPGNLSAFPSCNVANGGTAQTTCAGATRLPWATGPQPPPEGGFNQQNGIGLDPSGNLYVIDTFEQRVQKFDSTSTCTSAASCPAWELQWGSRQPASLKHRIGWNRLSNSDRFALFAACEAAEEAGLEAIADQLGHRLLEEKRFAEVAASDPPDPDQELLDDRPLEAKLQPDLRHLLGRRAVARDDGGGIASGQTKEQERQDGHHRDHGNGGEHAADDVAEHGAARPASRLSGRRRDARTGSGALLLDAPENGGGGRNDTVDGLPDGHRPVPLS
jgi:hypothetical protein